MTDPFIEAQVQSFEKETSLYDIASSVRPLIRERLEASLSAAIAHGVELAMGEAKPMTVSMIQHECSLQGACPHYVQVYGENLMLTKILSRLSALKTSLETPDI